MMRYLKILAAGSLGVVLLGACGGPAEEPTAGTSSVSSAAAVARGVAESPIPEFANTPARRAAPYATSELAPHLTAVEESGSMPGWWRRLTETDGYVSIEISNITGDEPQAAPPPGSPTPTAAPGEELPLEVMFNRTAVAAGRVPSRGVKTQIWVVTVRDGLVVAFKPESGD